MHVVYVHPNFPAQFGHIASALVQRGHRCTFVSETPPGTVSGIHKVQYKPAGGATERTHYFARTFENAVGHAAGVYDALVPLAMDMAPDLIVGHSGFGTTLFLHELFPRTPVINYFEYFYWSHGSDLDFRTESPPDARDVLRSRARNAMCLLDLDNCLAGYPPSMFQNTRAPTAYLDKIRVIHDGVPTCFWRRRDVPRRLGERTFDVDTRIVTYVSRGFESMRGFDIFMQVAKRVCDAVPNVVFLVVGSDRICYGGDEKRIQAKTYCEHVLAQDTYDLARILFLGPQPPDVLVQIFSLSDLHLYLTVPFVLSWSVLDAMACGCVVLGSDTAPVREVVTDGHNGLLRGFSDVDGLTETALRVLEHPEAYRCLGRVAEETVREHYALDRTLPRMLALYDEVIRAGR